MPRRLRLALACLLLAAPSALADDLAERAECLRQALTSFLQYPVRFEGALADQGNGFFTQYDVALETSGPAAPPGRITSLEVYAFDCAGFRAGGVPGRLSLRASGVSVAPASHPLTALLPGLGSDSFFDVTLDLAYDAGTRRIAIDQLDLEFPGILTVALAGEASGIDLKGARFTAQGFAGLGLVAALTGTLQGAELWLWNESGDRLLDAFARGQGRSLEQQRALWLGQLEALIAAPGNEPAGPALRALRSFVQAPRQLRIRVAPPTGAVTLAPLVAAPTLGEQVRLLGLTAEANR